MIMKKDCDDIINLSHHVSDKHQRMAISMRAAQFSPFAALPDHEETIKESSRLTESKIEIDDNIKELLDIKLHRLKSYELCSITVNFVYFIPDDKKSGGKYIRIAKKVRKIDENTRIILLEDGTVIPIDSILEIDFEEATYEGISVGFQVEDVEEKHRFLLNKG